MSGTRRATLVALFVAAITLRPPLVGAGPLLPEIERDLDTSHAVAGLLGTIPVLCMGVFAPAAAFLGARVGLRRAMATGLALLGVCGILRGVAPSAWLVVLLTLPLGMGLGLGNALAPLVIKEWAPLRAAAGTGIYTSGIQIGATAAAFVAVPLAGLLGGWRWAFIVFAVAALVALATWLALTRGHESHVAPAATVPRLPWGSRRAWLLVTIFVLMSSSYYGLVAWLPDAYTERGWSDREAGVLLATMNLTAIPASFVVPWLSDRIGRRRPILVAMSITFIVGALGLVAAPGFAYGWGLVAGVAQGGLFALVMTLPLDFEHRPDRTAALVAMMLGLGYTLAAASPFLLGAVRDATGSFDAVLWVIVGLLCALLAAILVMGSVVKSTPARA